MDILKFKDANCKNCYKCIRECPVKAIEFKSGSGQAQIIRDDCLLCGRCVLVCPQNAKESRSDLAEVKALVDSGRRVIVSMAPSFIAEFPAHSIADMRHALQQLGVCDVEETAIGASVVKKEYERILKEEAPKVLISSCCHSIVKLIQDYHADALPYLAKVLSPMQAHGRLIKEKDPEAAVVFIGPCISKKQEVEESDCVDFALTFEELHHWLEESRVEIPQEEEQDEKFRARYFPITGGIVDSMDHQDSYRYVSVDGIEECREVLEQVAEGNLNGYFIELSACSGSCIHGPAMRRHAGGKLAARAKVQSYGTDKQDYAIAQPTQLSREIKAEIQNVSMPGEKEIQRILQKMGKTSPEKELNCGACGYPTCRDKAVAVYFGKADIEMCLPYMRERAESLSDQIINATPNAIMAMDSHLIVQQVNQAACELFEVEDQSSLKGRYVGEILPDTDFIKVLDDKQDMLNVKMYFSKYDKYVQKSIIYDEGNGMLVVVMQDITKQQAEADRLGAIKYETVKVADKVIEKQMRIVQEIASLLGETTAETKIALTKLKSAILEETK